MEGKELSGGSEQIFQGVHWVKLEVRMEAQAGLI